MSFVLERLITAALPLLTAVAGKRKARPSKRAARKTTHAALSLTKRRFALQKSRPKAAKSRALVAAKKNQLPRPSAPAPPPKPPEPERKPTPPTSRAILIAPENAKYVDSLNPTLRWLSVGGATRYEVWWGDEDHADTAQTLISISTYAAVPVEKPLSVGATYIWRVRGGNEAGWGPWSPTSTFRVVDEPFAA